jgi:hypothetical protein
LSSSVFVQFFCDLFRGVKNYINKPSRGIVKIIKKAGEGGKNIYEAKKLTKSKCFHNQTVENLELCDYDGAGH